MTLHPFVVYYWDENGTVQHKSYCVLSDYRKHSAETVHTFIQKLFP